MFQQPDEEVQGWQRGSSKQSSEQPKSLEEQRSALVEELHLRVLALVELWLALEYLGSISSPTETNDGVGDVDALSPLQTELT